MIKKKLLTSAVVVTLSALISGCVSSNATMDSNISEVTKPSYAPVTNAEILNDENSTGDVLTYGMGLKGQRYSPLTQVNKETVKNLVPVWNFSFGGEKQRGQESQPIVKDGVMYVTASYSRMFAIDLATGDELWQYNARLPDAILPCCDVINRGAAIYDNLVIFGTLDAKLVALNRKTGKVVWKKRVANYKDGYSITAAPMIVKDMVITGVAGGEFGIVGKVEARNAKTGEVIWSRPTVEGNMGYLNGKENGITGGEAGKTWPGDMWKTGGASTWLGGTYDPETDLLYFGTGNPAPWNSHLRPGDNLYSSSRLAINPNTGKIVWHFQSTPHDGWDFDGVNELVSFDYTNKDGKVEKLAGTADRNGFFYVLNRVNGKFVTAHPFVKNITWAKGIDKNGRPIYNEASRPGAAIGDGKGKEVFSVPSFLGGKNWMPITYSKRTKMFYVPSNEWGMDIWNQPVSYKKGAAYIGAGFTIKPIFKDHIGSLKAIDPISGKIKWEYKNKAPLWAGTLSTAGGLVFTGTPEGKFMAFDDETGKVLFKYNTGSGIVSSPITWEENGEQYIAIISGWGGAVPLWGGEVAKTIKNINQGGTVLVFKLHK
jgi:alcohol dehydrogenase (cytochrome c)